VHHGLPANALPLMDGNGGYLAFLGRISPEKGLDRAIDIAIRAGVKLKVAAKIDRADVDYFEKKIKHLLNHPLIEFIGEIGHGEKADFLGNAAALLFPIEWPEPFGLVMIEAMACGTPVIAHPYGSVPEIVPDGVCGYFVRNTNEAVEAVKRIGEIDRRECRRHFELNFTTERMAREHVKLYQQLVGPQPDSISVEEGVLNWMESESPTPSTT
jgi:glycosyltransferase involved in cell wall biosynthesis